MMMCGVVITRRRQNGGERKECGEETHERIVIKPSKGSIYIGACY